MYCTVLCIHTYITSYMPRTLTSHPRHPSPITHSLLPVTHHSPPHCPPPSHNPIVYCAPSWMGIIIKHEMRKMQEMQETHDILAKYYVSPPLSIYFSPHSSIISYLIILYYCPREWPPTPGPIWWAMKSHQSKKALPIGLNYSPLA